MRFMSALLFVVLLWAASAQAVVPRTLSFQGALRDETGSLLPDGDYEIAFRIFDVEISGEYLWEESQIVPVGDSMFSAVLGKTNPLDLPFDEQYWIELRVGNDPWMEPRLPLTAAPYSLNVAEGQAVTSINSVTDDVTLAGDGGVVVSQAGQTITISGSGGASSSAESLAYPDGFMDLEPVYWPLMSLMPYTVPAGKNLYITNVFCPQGDELLIDGLGIVKIVGNAPNRLPIIVGSGQIVSVLIPGFITINGFLVDAVVTPVTVDIGSGNYFPPGGQDLVVTHVYTRRTENPYWDLNIQGGAPIYRISTTDQTDGLDQPIIIAPGTYLSTTAGYPGSIIINGYLR